MANCKICGKTIPDGKSICNSCRLNKMSENASAVSAESTAGNPLPNKKSGINTVKNVSAASAAREIGATNTFSSISASDEKVYREPSQQPYVKYNAVSPKADGKNASDNTHTTMFRQTQSSANEEKVISPEAEKEKEERNKVRSRICMLFSSPVWTALCVCYTLFCFFSLADSVAKLNLSAFVFMICNTVICVNMWILFFASKFKKTFLDKSVKSIRKSENAKLVIYIMTVIFALLLAVAVFIVQKYEILPEEWAAKAVAFIAFTDYYEEIPLGPLIQPILLIYIPVLILIHLYYTYMIKLIHGVIVNHNHGKAIINYTVAGLIFSAIGICGSIFSYIFDKAAFVFMNDMLGSVLKYISAVPIPFYSSETNYGVWKLVFAIASHVIFALTVLAYRFTVTNAENKKAKKMFRFFIG